ncbi:unnamed protein product [Rotaria sordida]|uniref:Uncharacterized protein n=1 Tax=Rotaria sordida TaxID=392033 RepID=A0A815AHY2_9BILA|nr:unnamed protein product [Rotaria sordida]CAF1257695.1 unnamed protein product [Rotaria sordida]CAF3696566.1 unnamed protein product [Rotaria sordida]CAF4060556.1 unnamed protein product [Rotaria sordida]
MYRSGDEGFRWLYSSMRKCHWHICIPVCREDDNNDVSQEDENNDASQDDLGNVIFEDDDEKENNICDD